MHACIGVMMRTAVLFLSLIAISCDGSTISDAGPPDSGRPDSGTDAGAPGSVVHVRLLGITDFHGRMRPPSGSELGGVTYLASHIDRLRAEEPNTVVVSSGDLIGGSALDSAVLRDEPTFDAMDLIGLDITTVGNHEFDRPLEELRRLVDGGCHPVDGCADDSMPYDGASFDVLGANVIDRVTGEPAFPTAVIREVGGVNIAFIGVTLESTGQIVYSPFVEGLRFEDEADTVNALIPSLREQGATVFVVLVHEGMSSELLYEGCIGSEGALLDVVDRLDPAVDVVFAGHRHGRVHCRPTGGPLIIQAGRWGNTIGVADLVIDPATGLVVEMDSVLQAVSRDVPTHPEMDTYLEWLEGIVGGLRNEEVGRITATVSDAIDVDGNMAAGDLVADAFLRATASDAVVALTNLGGVRTSLLYEAAAGETEDGIVTYGELFDMVPFNNELLTMTLTGEQLDALLEAQFQTGGTTRFLALSAGFSYTWSRSAPIGAKVDPADVFIDGMPLDLSASYRVTLNTFIAEGGSGFEAALVGTERTPGRVDIDVVLEHLGAVSPYTPPPLDRVPSR